MQNMSEFLTAREEVCLDIILQLSNDYLRDNYNEIKQILDAREFTLASHVLSAKLFILDEVISSLDKYRSAKRYNAVVNKILLNDPDIDKEMLLLILDEEEDDACVTILRNVASSDKEKLKLVDIEYAKQLNKTKTIEYVVDIIRGRSDTSA